MKATTLLRSCVIAEWALVVSGSVWLLSTPPTSCAAEAQVLETPSGGTPAVRPIPVGDGTYTWQTFHREAEQWLKKSLLAHYDKHGDRAPEWDEKAKVFLETYASYAHPHSMKRADCLKELRPLGKELLALGCQDPCITYAYGNVVYGSGDVQEAMPLVKQALTLLEASEYPRIFLYYASRKLGMIYSQMPSFKKDIGPLQRRRMTYLGQAAADPDFSAGNQRHYVMQVLNEWDEGGSCRVPEHADILMKELERQPTVDPWIRAMVQGLWHLKTGWAARGYGWASSVTEDGWRQFSEEIAKARESFTQGHALHPEFPEAAAQMITVAMASCGEIDQREWFERAVSAQFDYRPAHDKLLWALRPRWGGSHQEMYQLGLECLNTGRFETEVPCVYLRALWEIGTELDDWRLAYRREGVYEHMATLFEGMLSEPSRAERRNYWLSCHALLAWAAEGYAA